MFVNRMFAVAASLGASVYILLPLPSHYLTHWSASFLPAWGSSGPVQGAGLASEHTPATP